MDTYSNTLLNSGEYLLMTLVFIRPALHDGVLIMPEALSGCSDDEHKDSLYLLETAA